MKMLVTGALGLVGGVVYRHLRDSQERFEVHALSRRRVHSVRTDKGTRVRVPEGRLIISDLSDLEELIGLLEGFDCIVHMAADPRPDAPWESISKSNLLASYNVFEAGRRAGVGRIIYASSVMATWGYRGTERYRAFAEGCYTRENADPPKISTADPVWPTCLYASSKVFGEALARHYSCTYGLSSLCLRIGAVNAANRPEPQLGDVWCSHRDIATLVEYGALAPQEVEFGIFFGVSDSPWRWVDIDSAQEQLGYAPQDDAGPFFGWGR